MSFFTVYHIHFQECNTWNLSIFRIDFIVYISSPTDKFTPGLYRLTHSFVLQNH